MLITRKFHLSEYDVPATIVSNGMNLYPLGDVNNDVYLYATMFKGLAFINVRKVTNAQFFSKEGITFNSWEVGQFRKLRPELELAIAEKKSGVLDCYVGKYKLIRYHVESQLMDLIKIKATDDHQEYGDASIRLDADETRAFFGTFARVDEEFRQLIASLPVKNLPTPAVVPTTATPAVATASSTTPAVATSSTATPAVVTTSAATPALATTSSTTPAVATTSASTSQKRKAPVLTRKEIETKIKKRIAALQAEQKVPKLKIDLSKINNM